ncbi:MAG: iron-sulfur cluster repair di-iron protein [Melioribacteraceae bacterium]|nr:iron-sulfur cluster repair di-iron protein [Melioribacteraceae bacterium]
MNNNIDLNLTVGDTVKNNYKTAGVFKKYKIDFCCGGNKTIGEVCSDKNINVDEFTAALSETANQSHDSIHNYNDWETDFLVKYIINVHHKSVKDNIPGLIEYTSKIADVHGERHPELLKVAELFGEISQELEHHLMKEEQILFPYILELHDSARNNLQPEPSPFGTVHNPIAMMIAEHENAGNLLKEIREITSDYTLPDDACNTYAVTYKKLDEFENDLHLHIHLENNILFPRAVKLEEGINGADNE